ncbi:hypothetical protein LTR33_013776, partial [Friedmanniomyces endolithicus]
MLPIRRATRSHLPHLPPYSRLSLLPRQHAFTTLRPQPPLQPARRTLSRSTVLHTRFASTTPTNPTTVTAPPTATTATTSANDRIHIKPRRRWVHYLQRSLAYFGLTILVSGALVVAFFAYDASTYSDVPGTFDIPVSEYALTPQRGGPKNLPIAEYFVSDDEPEYRDQKHKPKLVILGTGWASVALLKQLQAGGYHVTM